MISILSLSFALYALLGYDGPEYSYFRQRNTFLCAKPAHSVRVDHDHSFTRVNKDDKSNLFWEKAGLDFDPVSCDPFYMRSETLDQQVSLSDKSFFWFSRLENVNPSMW